GFTRQNRRLRHRVWRVGAILLGSGRRIGLTRPGRTFMPRLFTGLEVPADIGFLLSLKRGGLMGARWVDPDNYHITLRFIGDVDGQLADEVANGLDRLAHAERFPIRLTHLGTFGGDKPRTLFAGVEPSAALGRLQAAHERVLQRIGL